MDQYPENANQSVARQDTSATRVVVSDLKISLIIIVSALVLLASLWVWKSIEISQVEKRAEGQKQAIKITAKNQLMEAHEAHLKLLAKPMIWALRTEMMQGNMGQVNLYLSDLVKEKNIQRVLVANPKGTVIASTNKKDEGQSFISLGAGNIQNNDNTTIQQAGDSKLMVTSPIMGFNNRLGTLLIKYNIPKITF